MTMQQGQQGTPPGWYPQGGVQRWWDGQQWTEHTAPLAAPVVAQPVAQPAYRAPARTAHGAGYWLMVGWWWEPIAWCGRMLLWLFLWPVGLWRTLRKGRKNREARERRGR